MRVYKRNNGEVCGSLIVSPRYKKNNVLGVVFVAGARCSSFLISCLEKETLKLYK